MIGERLKRLRLERKIKQDEVAAIIGVNKSAVSHYETDKDDPSDRVKVEIAKYFNVSLDYLLGVIDDAVPYYDGDIFIMLPRDMMQDERMLFTEFLAYLEYRRSKV